VSNHSDDYEQVRCSGDCITAREIMYPPSSGYDPDAVAYPHPLCPLHGEQSGSTEEASDAG
jgi:hypothetical protein